MNLKSRSRSGINKLVLLLVIPVFIIGGYLVSVKRELPEKETGKISINKENDNYEKSGSNTEEEKEKRGERTKSPDELYREATGLDKINLTQEQETQKWNEVLSFPTDNGGGDVPYDTWTTLGPYLMHWENTIVFNGRALDLEFEGLPTLRVGSASGGLWKYMVIGIITIPLPMSDQVTSLIIGAFATKPNDTNTIIIGTGEPAYNNSDGRGLWKTTNGGVTWTNITFNPMPQHFFRIKYQPNNFNIVHAACNSGYFRSDNQGNEGTWVQRATGNVCDMAFNPSNPAIIFITKYGDGLYKSTNGGNSFTQVTTLGIPAGEFGRANITIAPTNSNIMYLDDSYPNGFTRCIYKTTDGGVTWQDRTWRWPDGSVHDYHWGQGNYGNCIAVCPTNADLVLAGGGTILRTTNGGLNWTESPLCNTCPLHADQHVIKWHSDGVRVYAGNDGGVNYSSNAGITWTDGANILPTSQFYGFSTAVLNNNIVMAGGLQDNMTAVSTNNGSNWRLYNGGDGWDAVVSKSSPMQIFAHNNNFFSKTTNGGVNWTGAGTGLNSALWVSNFDDDGAPTISPYIYVGNDNKVYSSTNMGTNFSQFTATTFNTTVWRLTSTSLSTGATILYNVQWNNGSPNQNDVLRVWDGSAWQNRGAGLPLTPLRWVCPHPRSSQKAYALTDWYGSTQKVFKTTNRGVNWQNITGDLPNIPMTDLIPHPTNDNILYLGTDYGMWRTSNGGTNWTRWTNGIPVANKITDLEYIDSVAAGKFYILASSHGRGVWIRDASTSDPVAVNNNNENIPNRYELMQNYPNPFNPNTTIKFSMPVDDNVEIKIFDLLGREVGVILNQKMNAGQHEIKFDGSNLSSGIYFYTMKTSRFTDTKKMVLVK